jgi:hypothetical protein
MNLDVQESKPAVMPDPVEKQKAVAEQAVTGVMPPSLGEARIRETRPSVTGTFGGLAAISKRLMELPSGIAGMLPSLPVVTAVLWPVVWTALALPLLPLAWLLLLPGFLWKFMPFLCPRYTLTNRRLMIQRGLKPHPTQEIALADIDDVRMVPGSLDDFYLSANLEVVSKGQVVMHLSGVREPESFRLAVLHAVKAWVPAKATGPFIPASAK